LKIEQVDLVGYDSGGGIAQIFAASYPERVRSLTLSDCDAHDNWPPEPFKPFLAMAAAGGLRGTLDAMLADKSIYRSPQALGPAYEHPERLMRLMTACSVLIVAVMVIGSIFAQSAVGTNVQTHALWV
jgi:pimeloyl-ACP methyl ester carboxylesterase